jgi:hypothetical protein
MFAPRAAKNEEISEYSAARAAVSAQGKKQMPSPRFRLKINADIVQHR